MYYDKQPEENRESYKEMLRIIGSLSRLFSDAKEPYLAYRAHENIFCKYFGVENNARSDDSADAYSKSGVGIGLKTWVGNDDQKVAEFGRLRDSYKDLSGLALAKQIGRYRNKRILTTMNAHGLHEMLYHIVKRVPGAMCIYEAAFDTIDIDNIEVLEGRGLGNNIYFTDGKHTYHFSLSKNTLYMLFERLDLLDKIDVEITDDPFSLLSKIGESVSLMAEEKEKACLRLYSVGSDGKFVARKSGLNQWNASGRKRDENEVYIPFPAEDRKRMKGFFPPRDEHFTLILPDMSEITAKVCQQNGKAIMSNPNNALGKWLLRKVLELPPGMLLTYDMLKECNVDCVIFTKEGDHRYSADFGTLGTYEKFYDLSDSDEE